MPLHRVHGLTRKENWCGSLARYTSRMTVRWLACATALTSLLVTTPPGYVAQDVAQDVAQAAGQGAAPAGQGAAPGAVDRTRLMADVTTLASPAFEGRKAGSRGGLKAREWIVEQFTAIGLSPAGRDGYVQPLSGGAANVLGRLPGRDPAAPTLIISAHYDHDGIKDGVLYPGADDNASGVAVLLAAARHFRANPPRHPLIFAAFDAEEEGLRGSRAFIAANLVPRARIALNINLDMVSRNDANEIYAAGTSHYPHLRPMLDDIRTRSAVTILFGHDRPTRTGGRRDDWTDLSDHASFHAVRIPFVYFGVEDHADYHKPTDTADTINPRFFGDVAEMIVEAVRTFDARLD